MFPSLFPCSVSTHQIKAKCENKSRSFLHLKCTMRGGGKQCRSVHRWVEFCSSGYVCCLITLARFSPTQRGSNKTFNGVTSSLTTLFLFPSQAMYSACCTVSPSSTTVCSTIWDVGVRRPSSRWWSWIARWAAHANASGRSAPDWPHRDQPSS